MQRRELIAMAAAGLLPAAPAWSQGGATYPSRVLKLVVGFPPGQATDTIARVVAERLSQRLGQPILVDNRAGQGGSLALGYLTQQAADGYTIAFSNTGAVVTNQFIQKSLSYKPEQLQPVAMLGDIPLVLVARPDAPFKDMGGFVDQARAQPGKYTYSTPGNGTTSHLAMESLKQAAKIDVVHVPYSGSSRSLTDLMAGTVDVSFDTLTTIHPFVESQKLKALAVGIPQRLKLLPNVPTLAELGYKDIIGAVWVGCFVPTGTPADVARRLETEIQSVLREEDVARRLNAAGLYARSASDNDLRKIVATDTGRIQQLVKQAGLKAD